MLHYSIPRRVHFAQTNKVYSPTYPGTPSPSQSPSSLPSTPEVSTPPSASGSPQFGRVEETSPVTSSLGLDFGIGGPGGSPLFRQSPSPPQPHYVHVRSQSQTYTPSNPSANVGTPNGNGPYSSPFSTMYQYPEYSPYPDAQAYDVYPKESSEEDVDEQGEGEGYDGERGQGYGLATPRRAAYRTSPGTPVQIQLQPPFDYQVPQNPSPFSLHQQPELADQAYKFEYGVAGSEPDVQIHEHLAHFGPMGGPKISHDLSVPPIVWKNTHITSDYPSDVLMDDATNPPFPSLTIVCPEFLKWEIVVQAQPGHAVKVQDVLAALYRELRTPVRGAEYSELTADVGSSPGTANKMVGQASPAPNAGKDEGVTPKREEVNDAFFYRISCIADDDQRLLEHSKGVKRVDFLRRHTRFMGLMGTRRGPNILELCVEKQKK